MSEAKNECVSVCASERRGGRSFRAAFCGVVVGAILVSAGPAIASKSQALVHGAGWAGKVREERFIFRQNNGPRAAVDVERNLVKVPAEYGEPFAVTMEGTDIMVWYRSPTLGVRNVRMIGNQELVHVLQADSIDPKKSVLGDGGR